jgi:acyl-CoA dehydrogenase
MNNIADPAVLEPAAAEAALSASTLDGLRARARSMARIAAEHAQSVDREARFPKEAYAVAKSERLLGMLIPREFGGDGASISDAAEVSYILGQACGATSLIFSMHSIMIAILVRHAQSSAWHQGFMRKIADEQLLVASSTTEGLGGGDVRSSSCFVEPTGGGRMKMTREATVLSYAVEADALLTTSRRSAESAPSDQVLVALVKGDYHFEPLKDWNVMGMRGTSSAGHSLKATGLVEQVLPVPYDVIHKHSMGPIAHLTWGGTWAGVAAGAVARARQFVRTAARQANGQLPPGAPHLTRATMSLRALRGQLAAALLRFEAAGSDPKLLESLDFQTSMTLLKVNNSELAIETVMSALRACGLSGYREEGEFSVTRHLRDILSSMIMINNDRILANAANAAMLSDVPSFLRD